MAKRGTVVPSFVLGMGLAGLGAIPACATDLAEANDLSGGDQQVKPLDDINMHYPIDVHVPLIDLKPYDQTEADRAVPDLADAGSATDADMPAPADAGSNPDLPDGSTKG